MNIKITDSKEQEVKHTKSNIKCSKCAYGDFYYIDDIILLSFPPQKNVRCNSCDFRTTVVLI